MSSDTSDFLKRIALFSVLNDQEAQQLSRHLHNKRLEDGETLFCQGENGAELFVVEDGMISVVVELPDGREMDIAELSVGDFVGEMSIFEREPRSATCRARGVTRLLSMHESDLFSFVEDNPTGATKLMRQMLSVTRQRLNQRSAFLADMVHWGEAARRRAITDELTGLHNRRYFDDSYVDYVTRSRAEDKPLSVMMCDLDYFHQINELYTQAVGDQVIQSAAELFKHRLRPGDIAARYGGDEFIFILPDTEASAAFSLGENICRDVANLDILENKNGSIDRVTTTLGIATLPDHAVGPQELRDAADAALYRAKEAGRNRVALAEGEQDMQKHTIPTIAGRNKVVNTIIDALDNRKSFLMIGHKNPDEDCIASMVAFALLAKKFDKEARICILDNIHEHFGYLLNICQHNSIYISEPCELESLELVDTIVICDTPKPDMVQMSDAAREVFEHRELVKIEIDHHLEADSAYIGDPDYSLVTEASSASELVGLVALKLYKRKDLLETYRINDLFSRNFVLSVLTGIVGDSKMGKFLKTRRERRFYDMFSAMFNELLFEKTTNLSNFFTKEEVFGELGRLSEPEQGCFQFFIDRGSSTEMVGHVALSQEDSDEMFSQFDNDTVVSVSRSVADVLAEESKYVSLVGYYDKPEKSNMVQFRVRRSNAYRNLDLRDILKRFDIKNGGGHEEAIGFRFDRSEIPDIREYATNLVEGISDLIKEHPKAIA